MRHGRPTLGVLWDSWTVQQRYCVLLRTCHPMHVVEYYKFRTWCRLLNRVKGSVGRLVQREGPEPWKVP